MTRHPFRAALPAASGLFLAACVLGIFFNAASPLGVRIGSAHPDSVRPVLEASADSPFRNETIQLSFESSPPPPTAAPATAAPAHAQPSVTSGPVDVKSLTWWEVSALLTNQQTILVDARDSAAFEAGHIPGAVSLPANFSQSQINGFLQVVPKTTPVVVYCANSQCPLGRRLAGVLKEQYGFKDVREMPGGYVEWRVVQAASATKADHL